MTPRVEPHVGVQAEHAPPASTVTRSGKLSASSVAHGVEAEQLQQRGRGRRWRRARSRSHRSSAPYSDDQVGRDDARDVARRGVEDVRRGAGREDPDDVGVVAGDLADEVVERVDRHDDRSAAPPRRRRPGRGRGRAERAGAGGSLFENAFSSRRSYTRGPIAGACDARDHGTRGGAPRGGRPARARRGPIADRRSALLAGVDEQRRVELAQRLGADPHLLRPPSTHRVFLTRLGLKVRLWTPTCLRPTPPRFLGEPLRLLVVWLTVFLPVIAHTRGMGFLLVVPGAYGRRSGWSGAARSSARVVGGRRPRPRSRASTLGC